jgi:hypothetical protein
MKLWRNKRGACMERQTAPSWNRRRYLDTRACMGQNKTLDHYHDEIEARNKLCGESQPTFSQSNTMGFAGYVAVCVQLYCRCFLVLHLAVTVLHYMFRHTWPSSSV